MILSANSTLARKINMATFLQERTMAFIRFAGMRLQARPTRLDDFATIKPSLQAGRQYLGIRQVALNQITGSLERCQDFDREFRPRKLHLRQRWANLYVLAKVGKWPPVRLYQVGERYYVGDGHHRLSVARALGMAAVQAEVWQCQPG